MDDRYSVVIRFGGVLNDVRKCADLTRAIAEFVECDKQHVWHDMVTAAVKNRPMLLEFDEVNYGITIDIDNALDNAGVQWTKWNGPGMESGERFEWHNFPDDKNGYFDCIGSHDGCAMSEDALRIIASQENGMAALKLWLDRVERKCPPLKLEGPVLEQASTIIAMEALELT